MMSPNDGLTLSHWCSRLIEDKMTVIDSDDEDEEDKTLLGFMLSHLDSKMDSFKDTLANLMQRALEYRHACDNFMICFMIDYPGFSVFPLLVIFSVIFLYLIRT